MTDDPRVEAARQAFVGSVMWQAEESDDGQYDLDTALADALAAADKAAWRPVSEAPKDGTPVLIWGPATSHALGPVEHHAPTVCVAAFRGGLWVGAAVSYLNWHPTHFMPLPAPPSDD